MLRGVPNGTVVPTKVGFIGGKLVIENTSGVLSMADSIEAIVAIAEIKVKEGDDFVVLWSANKS